MISPSSRCRSDFAEHCQVREVAVEFIGSWLSSYDPFEFETSSSLPNSGVAVELVGSLLSSYDPPPSRSHRCRVYKIIAEFG